MREKFLSVVLAAAGLLMAPASLIAHHGTASFDTEKELTLKGTVTGWTWSNPHCFLRFDVKDENGTTRSWMAETQNPTSMTSRGWARTSFKPGEAVTVTLEPIKGGAPVGRIRSVVLADGQTLTAIGQAPAVQPQPVR